MSEDNATRKESGPEKSPGLSLKRAAIGVLFFLILLIPRVRRLRRRVRLWTVIRISSGLAGLALVWLFYHGRGTGFIVAGILVILLGLLVRATPVQKSLDDRARELGALAVLNGGTITVSPGEPPCSVNIFASAERLTVESGARTVAEIPLGRVQRCAARALEPGEGKLWELEVAWGSPDPQTAKFRFAGFFAEHLARVAETAIENLRRKELTVLK
jgi:hypothetical protein